MRQTIVEKILSNRVGITAKSGDVIVSPVDFCFGQDVTGCHIINALERIGKGITIDKEKCCMVLDHASPSPSILVSEAHSKIRKFCKTSDIKLFEVGEGISHQIIAEFGYVAAGDVVIGADSHTMTLGALNAFAAGVSSGDLAIALTSGKIWLKVPETIKVVLRGKLSKGVFAKDAMLRVIKDIGPKGAAYKAIEFDGDGIDALSMDERFTVTNMAAETGAKCAVMRADKKTVFWIKKNSAKEPRVVEADSDAKYAEVREYDLSRIVPEVALPHSPSNARSVEEAGNIPIHEVCIGSCSSGRLEDLEIAARILKGKKTAQGLKLIITPASRRIYMEALAKGFIETFVEAGAVVNNPGCGPCAGLHQGLLTDGENALTTFTRNCKGRMGSAGSNVYIASAATSAATALTGKISDPREHKRRLF